MLDPGGRAFHRFPAKPVSNGRTQPKCRSCILSSSDVFLVTVHLWGCNYEIPSIDSRPFLLFFLITATFCQSSCKTPVFWSRLSFFSGKKWRVEKTGVQTQVFIERIRVHKKYECLRGGISQFTCPLSRFLDDLFRGDGVAAIPIAVKMGLQPRE